MTSWMIIGLIIYIIIGFIYATTMLLIIISESKEDDVKELSSISERLIFIAICTIFWIILIVLSLIYRLYNKIKGGN